MKRFRIVALLTVLGLLSSSAVGQQQAPPPAQPPAQQPAQGATPPAQPSATPPAATPPAATPPAVERGPVNDEEFIPSEELSADEEVTFPVGI